jgi:hypothetical protein
VALDSGEFGPVEITKSVSLIAAPGVHAGISVVSGNAITINAGDFDTIILRGLTVNNEARENNTSRGIMFVGRGTLGVETCIVAGFPAGQGLFYEGARPGSLEVKDSIFRGNDVGIEVLNRNLTAQSTTDVISIAVIDHVLLEKNGLGLEVTDACGVSVHNTIASNNRDGFSMHCFGSGELNLESCLSSNNSEFGILSFKDSSGTPMSGTPIVRVSNSTVTNNKFCGLATLGPSAVLLSRGNNTVEGNGVNTIGTIASYTAK